MKVIVIILALLPLPAVAALTYEPYKEVLHKTVRSKQPVVYARVMDGGFGVQYRRDITTGNTIGLIAGGLLGGQVGGLVGMVAGSAIDGLAGAQPTELSMQDASTLAPFMDRNAAQRDLEAALAHGFAAAPLFAMPAILNALPPGAPADVAAFNEDPVLVVELYASLLTDYTGLQVTAFARVLSSSAFAADPKATPDGRVYRNRFDYISPLFPPTHVKTKREIKADVAAVKERYDGRKLSPAEEKQMRAELKEASDGTTVEKYRLPLLEQWTANDGARLREELQLGTKVVAHLLARDLTDYSAVDVRRNFGSKGWGTLNDSSLDRQVRVYYGGPFAGSLVSWPARFVVHRCQGIAFHDTVPRESLPAICVW